MAETPINKASATLYNFILILLLESGRTPKVLGANSLREIVFMSALERVQPFLVSLLGSFGRGALGMTTYKQKSSLDVKLFRSFWSTVLD